MHDRGILTCVYYIYIQIDNSMTIVTKLVRHHQGLKTLLMTRHDFNGQKFEQLLACEEQDRFHSFIREPSHPGHRCASLPSRVLDPRQSSSRGGSVPCECASFVWESAPFGGISRGFGVQAPKRSGSWWSGANSAAGRIAKAGAISALHALRALRAVELLLWLPSHSSVADL